MEKNLFKEETNLVYREERLKAIAISAETISYTKPLKGAVVSKMKDELVQLDTDIIEKSEEKKALVKEYNDDIKAMREKRGALVDRIKHKSEFIKDTCYKVVDREERRTGYYDKEGELVLERPATVEEMQPKLFSIVGQTGTDD